MPTKVVLFAPDIAAATRVVEYALSQDCALEEYVKVDPPLAKPTRSKSGSNGHGLKLRVVPGHVFKGEGTIREQAYECLLEHCPGPAKQTEMIESLIMGDWEDTQAKTAVAGLRKSGALVEV